MYWVSKVIAPLALVAGMAVTTTVVMADGDGNQPPFGKGGFGQPGKGFPGKDDKKKTDDKKTDKKEDKKAEKKDDRKAPTATAKTDPQVEAWLAILLTKITDPHDTVRDSARGAIVAVGAPALPAFQKLADGDDSAKAVAARKMISAIQGRGGDRGGPPTKGSERGGPSGERGFGPPSKGGERGPGGFGGFGGFGPGGFGGRGGPGGERGGPPGKGPGRGGRDEESQIEVAPMPRGVATR